MIKNINLNSWILIALMFCCIAYNKITPLVIALFVLIAIVKHRNWKDIRMDLFNWKTPGFWLMLFYLFHIIGMFWTENTHKGWEDIGMKLSFFILPLFFLIGKMNLDRRTAELSFILSCSITVICLIVYSIFRSIYNIEDNQWGYFYEAEFTPFMHRSYFASYMIFGAFLALMRIRKENGRLKMILILSFFLLSIATWLTLSKSGMLIWLLVLLFISVHYIITNRRFIIGFGLLFIVGTFVFLLFQMESKFASRLKEIPKALKNIQTENNPSVESNQSRIIMWSTSWKLIVENPVFGTGTGDVKDELIAKNEKLNNSGVAQLKLNAHNQFLNSGVQLGLIGLGLLLMVFTLIFREVWINKDRAMALFGVVFFLSFLVESFLETQAGIIPFTVLLMVFYTTKKREVNLKN